MNEEIRGKLRDTCMHALNIINNCMKMQTSDVTGRLLKEWKDEIQGFILEAQDPHLTAKRVEIIGQHITSMGQELISYGLLTMPPKNQN